MDFTCTLSTIKIYFKSPSVPLQRRGKKERKGCHHISSEEFCEHGFSVSSLEKKGSRIHGIEGSSEKAKSPLPLTSISPKGEEA